MSQPPIVWLNAKKPGFHDWTLAWQFSKNYIGWILASPIIQSGNGLAFPKANAGPFFFFEEKSR